MLAKLGRYDNAAVSRGLPEEMRARYFRQDGNVWVVSDELKNLVTFRKFNLQDSMEPLGRFDIVFMRYVSIYFSEPFKQQIYKGVAKLLSPEGSLIISAVESLRGISDDFVEQSHTSGTYYRCMLT
jgi:chemotaxis protein methyltransferase CheR